MIIRASFILVISLGLGCANHLTLDRSQNISFAKASPKSETPHRLILFIHGILGNSESTWTNNISKAYWPKLISEDQDLSTYDVALASYPTAVCGEISNLSEVTARLRERISAMAIFANYDEVYIVSHSMGGIVTKKLLIDLAHRDEMDSLGKIKAIFLMATPSQGAPLSSLAAHLCPSAQIANMEPMHLNSWLQDIETSWSRIKTKQSSANFLIPRMFCAYEVLKTNASLIVPLEYTTTKCDNEPFPVESNHIDIVKPQNKDSDVYVFVKNYVLKTSSSIALKHLSRNQLSSPTYTIEETMWVLDLTTRVPIPETLRESKLSKVVLERRDRLEKMTDKNEEFILYAGTSGNNIQWEGVYSSARHEFKELSWDSFRLPLKRSYNYILHIADKPAGFKSEILNRYTYSNGFQGDNEEWWSAEVKYHTNRAVVFITFPKDKPCKRITAYIRHSDENREEIKDNIPMITSGGNHAYWIGSNLKGASKLLFRWEW